MGMGADFELLGVRVRNYGAFGGLVLIGLVEGVEEFYGFVIAGIVLVMDFLFGFFEGFFCGNAI